MAGAAAHTLNDYFKNSEYSPKDFDLIVTGDLGIYGKEILKDFYEGRI